MSNSDIKCCNKYKSHKIFFILVLSVAEYHIFSNLLPTVCKRSWIWEDITLSISSPSGTLAQNISHTVATVTVTTIQAHATGSILPSLLCPWHVAPLGDCRISWADWRIYFGLQTVCRKCTVRLFQMSSVVNTDVLAQQSEISNSAQESARFIPK